MPDSAVIPATTTFRMSSLAWALAVQGATETARRGASPDVAGAGSGPAPVILAGQDGTAGLDGAAGLDGTAGLDETARSAIATELTTAGITDDAGRIRPQWLLALRQGAAAPIRVGLVSRWGGFSTHCRVNLSDGKGLAVEFTRPVATAADGSVAAAGIADVVTVTLLSETVLWPVLARSMPPFPELTAGADHPGTGTGNPGPVPGPDGGKAKATVYLDVQSRWAGTGLQYHGAGVWALSDSLHAVRTTGPATARRLAMAEAPPGDIARQLVWHVLGAHDFLAGGTPTEAAS